jgi:lipopolysaccharide export system permease protein
MKFNPEILQSAILDPDILPLTSLAKEAVKISSSTLTDKESKIMTALYWKLTIPWLSLLAIIAPAPFCVRFSRQTPIFFIYMASLFGLLAFYMLMDAAQVVAKRQVIPPVWAICGPFIVLSAYVGWRFHKLNTAS